MFGKQTELQRQQKKFAKKDSLTNHSLNFEVVGRWPMQSPSNSSGISHSEQN